MVEDKLLIEERVITDVRQQCCVWCFNEVESFSHMFVTCPKVSEIWRPVFKWLDLNFDEWSQQFLTFQLG